MTVDVLVKEKSGKSKENVEVCLVVVDESVLALTGYQLENPLSLFYPLRSQGQINKTNKGQGKNNKFLFINKNIFTKHLFLSLQYCYLTWKI